MEISWGWKESQMEIRFDQDGGRLRKNSYLFQKYFEEKFLLSDRKQIKDK